MSICPIIIFAKAPRPGHAKTRLARSIGNDAAARLAARMLEATVSEAVLAGIGPVELCCTPDGTHPAFERAAREHGIAITEQGDGDLGARMHWAFERKLAIASRAILIGTDCPSLTAEVLRAAGAALERSPAVFVPAADGGYVLVGLRSPIAELFSGIEWSTAQVMAQTRERLTQLGVDAAELAPLHDIDEPRDLCHVPAQWFTHPPLQGASTLASVDRSAGDSHASRNPCSTPSPPLEREGEK